MALLLGIDTGGTFTDAVILDDTLPPDCAVLAKAKALTTRHDLSVGIEQALHNVLGEKVCEARQISLVCLSTTLATNALVEGQGERAALVAIGFNEQDMRKAGLDTALGNDPLLLLSGGHTTHGEQAAPLDITALESRLEELAESVSGFAVTGYFAVRNPAHEQAVADLIISRTGKPVTCSHELSANLNGPKRALTTLLNARLVPIIAQLVRAARNTLKGAGINAPLMVVRGDGALVSADFAGKRPIETILSGPAASLVGARYLTGLDSALVNDVGGTTSDVAVLEDGLPKLDRQGALVGGYRTMVEAVAMRTFGLGGDSEISLGGSALNPIIELGPRRAIPISLLAKTHGPDVHAALDAQIKAQLPQRNDGRFAFRAREGDVSGLSVSERSLFERLKSEPLALNDVLQGHAQGAALSRLVASGHVRIAALTPSDALHVLGEQTGWDAQAAEKALLLFGRRRDGAGQAFCKDPHVLAQRIVDRMRRRSAEVVLETAFANSDQDPALVYNIPVSGILDRRQSAGSDNALVDISLKLKRPLIGLGASAHAWHPQAAQLLETEAIIPAHANVANAIGAVVGQISVSVKATITQPAEGRFQVSGLEKTFANEGLAFSAAEESARKTVESLAVDAGAAQYEITISHEVKRADLEGRDTLVEAVVTAVAAGRPAISKA